MGLGVQPDNNRSVVDSSAIQQTKANSSNSGAGRPVALGVAAAAGALGLALSLSVVSFSRSGASFSDSKEDLRSTGQPPKEDNPLKSSLSDPLNSLLNFEKARASEGWTWDIRPSSIEGLVPASRFVRVYLSTAAPNSEDVRSAEPVWTIDNDELQISIPRKEGASYQLAVFTEDGHRVNLSPSSSDPHSIGFFLPQNPDLVALGIQRGRPDELIKVAQSIYELATNVGLNILPPRKIDEPYNFSLSNVEGGLIKSEDLRGKVVIIFDWATWCLPCHAYLANTLLPILEKNPDTIQLIAISHDNEDLAPTALSLMKSKFPLKTLHAAMFSIKDSATDPQDPLVERAERTFWLARLGLSGVGIPRVMILSSEGILRFDDSAPAKVTLDKILKAELFRAD